MGTHRGKCHQTKKSMTRFIANGSCSGRSSRKPPIGADRPRDESEDAAWPLSPAYRWHHQLVAAAGALVDVLAFAELEVACHADAHFAQLGTGACHRDAGPAHARIGLHEGVLDLVRRDVQRRLRLEIFR